MTFPKISRLIFDNYVILLLWNILCMVLASTSTTTTDVSDTSNHTTNVTETTAALSASYKTTTAKTTTAATTTSMVTSPSPSTQAEATTLLPTTEVFPTLDATASQSTAALVVDCNTGLLTIQFYYGLGMGAGVCLIMGFFVFLIQRQCRQGKGSRSEQEFVQKREDPGNLYEIAVGQPIGVPDPTAYDMPDEEGQLNTRVFPQRIPNTAKVKRKEDIKTHTCSRTEVVAYDEVAAERGDNTAGEYEEIPKSYRQRKFCRAPPSPAKIGERSTTPEKTRRPRLSRKKKEIRRHVEPPYVNEGCFNRSYLPDTGNEAGYLPMNQFRVATVTETYVDMTQDFVRPRRQETRKSKDSDDNDEDNKPAHDYINVTDMDITPPSQRCSGEPLINRNSKDSAKKRKWGLKYFSDDTNMKLKNKFPFFQRTSKAKVPMVDPSRNRETCCLYDDALGIGAGRASQLCVDGLEKFGTTGNQGECESDGDTSVCSHTTDSLCNEMMGETLKSV